MIIEPQSIDRGLPLYEFPSYCMIFDDHQLRLSTLFGVAMNEQYWLVVSNPLKNMKVNWDDCFQYMEKYYSCSKPTRIRMSSLNWEVDMFAAPTFATARASNQQPVHLLLNGVWSGMVINARGILWTIGIKLIT